MLAAFPGRLQSTAMPNAAVFAALPLLALCLDAQDAPTQPAPSPATARLQKALAAAAAQPSGAFTAEWGPTGKQAQQGNVVMMVGGLGNHQPGNATGSWAPGQLHVAYDDGEVLFVGRQMLARDGQNDWCLRRDLLADGSQLPFVPDVPALLRLLAQGQLAVTHQEVGTRDDRPVEILSATLDADQVADAIWGGAVPKVGGSFAGAVAFQRLAVAGGAARPAVPKPQSQVDLAFVIDPATATVHEITIRSAVKNDAGRGGAFAVAINGAGQVQQLGGDDEEEEEDAAAAEKAAAKPLEYKDGLPQRPRKKTTVWDYKIGLQQLGTAAPVELTPAAKRLTGAQ